MFPWDMGGQSMNALWGGPTPPYENYEGITGNQFPTLGASLAGAPYQAPGSAPVAPPIPFPTPRPMDVPGMPMDLLPPNPGASAGAMAQGGGGAMSGSMLQNALRGVQMMQPPAPQTVRTPPPPKVEPVHPSEVINMLSALGIGPHQIMTAGGGLGGMLRR